MHVFNANAQHLSTAAVGDLIFLNSPANEAIEPVFLKSEQRQAMRFCVGGLRRLLTKSNAFVIPLFK